MDALLESDHELEQRAKAQAEAVALAHMLAQETKLQQFWRSMGHYLGLSRTNPNALPPMQRPGRELLLWQMRSTTDLSQGLELTFDLIGEPKFVATIPNNHPCPIASHMARRSWNEAVREWSSKGGGALDAWVRCDRKLWIERQNATVTLSIQFKDLYAHLDPKTGQLAPVRVEGSQKISADKADLIVAMFDQLTPFELAESLRAPARTLMADFETQRLGAKPDAYIAQGPLRMRLEEFTTSRPNKANREVSRAEEVGKGFAAWLATLIKANNGR